MKRSGEALRKGLTLIVPEGLLNLLTWRELETLVCGKSILDIELLKMNTNYRVTFFIYKQYINYLELF